MSLLDETRYGQLVAETFKRLLQAADAADPDALEADSTGDMITFTGVRTGQKCVVNTQRAVRQLWVAGKSQGIHFDWDEGTRLWKDDKGKGLELFAFVTEAVEDASGERLSFETRISRG